MSKEYDQTGVSEILERGKGGPLQRVTGGIIENRTPDDADFLQQRGADGASPDDFATFRQAQAFAPITDPSILIVPGPPDTISPPVGTRAIIAGAPTPGGPVQINFPVATAAQNGQRIGVVITSGNGGFPGFDITVFSPSQGIIFPSAGFIPPGSPVTVAPADSLTGYTVWVWQFVQDLGGWVFDWNVSPGGAGGTWADVLSNGNQSGANDPIVDEPQRLISASINSFSGGPQQGYRIGRTVSFASSGTNAIERVGTPIYSLDTSNRTSDLLIVKIMGTIRVDLGINSLLGSFTIDASLSTNQIIQAIELTGSAALQDPSDYRVFLGADKEHLLIG